MTFCLALKSIKDSFLLRFLHKSPPGPGGPSSNKQTYVRTYGRGRTSEK